MSKCRGFKLTIEQAQDFKDYYSVIPFPHDEFTGEPIRLTEEQRKEFVKQFNDQRRNNRKINLLWKLILIDTKIRKCPENQEM